MGVLSANGGELQVSHLFQARSGEAGIGAQEHDAIYQGESGIEKFVSVEKTSERGRLLN